MGTPASGIAGHIRGWHVGARVECEPDNRRGGNDKSDVCYVVATGGSTNSRGTHVATLRPNGNSDVTLELEDTPIVHAAIARFLAEHPSG